MYILVPMMQLTSEKEKELDNILILKKFIATSLPNPRECVYNLIMRRDDGEIALRFKKKKIHICQPYSSYSLYQ